MADLPPNLEALLVAAQEYNASDLLLHEGQHPRLRMGGKLAELELPEMTGEIFEDLRCAAGAPESYDDFDGSVTSNGGVRFRVNLLRHLGKRAAVLRRINSEMPALAGLGLPTELLQQWSERTSGIILVCGPTGSGKSTTLAATLQWMNENYNRHIVTIEDPVEFLFRNNQCIFTQREVGIDTTSFAEGMRRALRQNPDVILVGEIRDATTALTAVQAAETGHLVLATLHSSSCPDGIERLQLLFAPEDRDGVRRTLAAQLLGMICQRLIPKVAGGVILATEYFDNVGATRKYIGEGAMEELSDYLRRADGSSARDFAASLVAMVRDGLVTEEQAMSFSDRPQELQRTLRGISSMSKATRV